MLAKLTTPLRMRVQTRQGAPRRNHGPGVVHAIASLCHARSVAHRSAKEREDACNLVDVPISWVGCLPPELDEVDRSLDCYDA